LKKDIGNIVSWTLFIAGVLFTMSFVSNRTTRVHLSTDKLNFEFVRPSDNSFLTESIVKQRIAIKLGYQLDSMAMSSVNLEALELQIKAMPEVKAVEVYKTVNGKLNMRITERKPIVRVIHQNGMSNYIDEEGDYMGLSSHFSDHLPVVTGYFNESDYTKGVNALSHTNDLCYDDIYFMSSYIHKDPFWKAQILEIHINKDQEFELIPRVGNHRILFGKGKKIKKKFKKLKIFYREGLNHKGWNQFDTLNIMYKNQIVCS